MLSTSQCSSPGTRGTLNYSKAITAKQAVRQDQATQLAMPDVTQCSSTRHMPKQHSEPASLRLSQVSLDEIVVSPLCRRTKLAALSFELVLESDPNLDVQCRCDTKACFTLSASSSVIANTWILDAGPEWLCQATAICRRAAEANRSARSASGSERPAFAGLAGLSLRRSDRGYIYEPARDEDCPDSSQNDSEFTSSQKP